MKRYRLPLSRVFPVTHSRKGERTFFREKIIQALNEYWPAQCKCGWIGSSEECNSYPLGDSGDHSDPSCPVCESVVGDFNCDPKLHTIRENVEYWRQRIDEINAGKAVLEVYEWTGKPYRSPAKTLFEFNKNSGIGYQILQFIDSEGIRATVLNEMKGIFYDISMDILAKNDGLSLKDFKEWFRKSDYGKKKIIIHFTKFRY